MNDYSEQNQLGNAEEEINVDKVKRMIYKIYSLERDNTKTGKYELMDSKLKLYNESNLMYEDLAGNMELSFTIVNDNTIKSLEKLVCTEEGTLFEK